MKGSNPTETKQANWTVARELFRRIFAPFILVVILSCVLGEVLVTHFFKTKAELSNVYKLNKLSSTEEWLDEVPIFGASMARNAFYPDSLGSNFYNYGMENAGFIINEQLIKLELKKNKSTPVILDFHWRGMEEDTTGSSINLRTFLPFLNEQKELKNFLQRYKRYRAHHSIPGARYYGSFSAYFKDYFAETYQPRKQYSRGGVFNREAPSQNQMNRLVNLRRAQGEKKFVYSPSIEARFEAMFESAPERQFLLISSPRHHSVMEMLMDYEEMKAWGQKMQDAHANVKVIIFECEYPDRFFKDTGHLSLEGAQVFSAQLRRVFEQLGYINLFSGESARDLLPPSDSISVFTVDSTTALHL